MMIEQDLIDKHVSPALIGNLMAYARTEVSHKGRGVLQTSFYGIICVLTDTPFYYIGEIVGNYEPDITIY
jgi:hypothetical protein